MKKTRFILVVCICLAFLVALSGCGGSQTKSKDNEAITLVLTTHENESSWWVQNILAPWIADTEQAAGGKLKIEAHYGGELVSIYDAYDATLKGTVDMAEIFPSMVSGQFPLSEINTLTSSDKINWRPGTTYWELIQHFPEMQAEYGDVHLLGVGQMFEPYLGTVKKPIRKYEDIKGMQYLAIGEYSSKRLAAWGATPANVPPGDLFPSLQKGVLEGTAVTLNTLDGLGLKDAIKYLSKVSNDSTNIAIVLNKDKWNSLPADLQQILTEQGQKFTRLHDEAQINAELGFQKKATAEYGIEFITLPQAELDKFEAAGAPVRDELAAKLDAQGLPGTAVKEYFLQLEDKYSAPEYAPQQ